MFSKLGSETEALISFCEHIYNWITLQILGGAAETA